MKESNQESSMFNNNQLASNFNESSSVDEYINSLPIGYRFSPSDEELIEYYLKPKIKNEQLPVNRFCDVDIYQFHPQKLTEIHDRIIALYCIMRLMKFGEKYCNFLKKPSWKYGRAIRNYKEGDHNLLRESEWYFFTSRDRKYPNGYRPNRAAAANGFWRATGVDKEINVNGKVIGKKRTLDFYVKETKERPEVVHPRKEVYEVIKTEWKMHEYRLDEKIAPPNDPKGNGDMKLDECVLCKIYENTRSKKVKANKNAETVDSDPGQGGVQPLTHVATHGFSDQSVQPEPADHQDQTPLIGRKSNSSPVLDNHYYGLPISTALSDKFGVPSYYESFHKKYSDNYSVDFAPRTHGSQGIASVSSPSPMQKYSNPREICADLEPKNIVALVGTSSTSPQLVEHYAMEYEPPQEGGYTECNPKGDDSFGEALDHYINTFEEDDQQHFK